MNISQTLHSWKQGIRFYIVLAIGLLSLETWWWAQSNFSGTSLFAIRLEEVFAWLAVGFLVAALLIGPLFRFASNLHGKRLAFESRRILGIGAAWFAALHASIAYISLFKLANPLQVPHEYRSSFLVGGIALIILVAMAATSFDRAMKYLGVWWFRLHRLVYVAAVLTLWHAFMIGTHAARPTVLLILAVLIAVVIMLHSLAITRQIKPASIWQLVTIGGLVAAMVLVLSYGYSVRSQFSTQASKGSHVQTS